MLKILQSRAWKKSCLFRTRKEACVAGDSKPGRIAARRWTGGRGSKARIRTWGRTQPSLFLKGLVSLLLENLSKGEHLTAVWV